MVDSIGLNPVFMVKNTCPPTSKTEVGKKGSLNIVFVEVKQPAIGGHFAFKAD